ncbi:MAG: S41 family peptidase [Desulfuromonadaceae bacterium]|nr:S41 family peptidase [Desulfuromonadaceae bacterium]
MPPHSKIRSVKPLLLIALVAAVCLAAVFYGRWHLRHTLSDANTLNLLREAYSAVLESYVDKPDSKKLVLNMVDGMLAALDPHSAYLPPEPYHAMEVSLSGLFAGIGIELGIKDGKLTVIAPIDDTPSFRAGIHANDHIWKIDGVSTNGMNIAAAVKKLRGEKGTPVTLTIVRAETSKPLNFSLVRDIIKVNSLKSRLLDSGYGFIRISQFQERTGSEFKEALKGLHVKSGGELRGLILDLRYNPGGLINSCVEVVNCFVGDDINNTAVVSIKGRTPEANRVYNATVGTKEPLYPLIILINGGSASASEIVAGALQDHKRAIIMGTQSFGKGSVQSIIPMNGNAALKLTTARYYTPSGRSIQAKGIVPDIEVAAIRQGAIEHLPDRREIRENDLDNRLAPHGISDDPQPRKMPEALRGQSVDRELQKDFQLWRAVELLQSLNLLKERGLIR